VIYQAWKNGARFDAWQDQFNFSAWQKAFESLHLDPSFYTHRTRPTDEIFPWDHIDTGVSKKFLWRDFLMSKQEQTREDCRTGCFACGILPTYAQLRRENPGESWCCPEVKTPRRAKKQHAAGEAVG
jgi:hypothetical protein